MRHGVSSGDRRRLRVHGSRAAAAARGAPRDRRGPRHGRLQRRGGRRVAATRRLRRPTRGSRTRRFDPARARRPRRRVPRAAARRVAAAPAEDRRPGRSRRRPRRRLPTPARASTRPGTASRTARRRCSPRSPTACRSCSATTSDRATAVAAPGCYPTAAALALAPLLAAAWSNRRASSSTRCRASRAGALAQGAEPVRRGDENVSAYGLLDHRHTGEIEHVLGRVAGRGGAGAVHAAPRADDARAPRHVSPRGRRARLDRATLLDVYREYYADEPFVVVGDGPPATKATLGIERVPRHRALRRTHRVGARDRRARQPGEGRVGPGDPGDEPRPRPAGDHRPGPSG